VKEILENLKRFADEHNLKLVTKGEVGFGRPCVGFLDKRGDHYLEYNPVSYSNCLINGLNIANIAFVEDLYDTDLYAPEGVDSYHKHNCFVVLVQDNDYKEALRQLNKWIEHIESIGKVEVVSYKTGATGLQAMVSGTTGYALRFVEKFAKVYVVYRKESPFEIELVTASKAKAEEYCKTENMFGERVYKYKEFELEN